MTFEMLDKRYKEICSMSIRPDKTMFPSVPKGTIIDRNQSVIWNEVAVQHMNEMRRAESQRLINLQREAKQVFVQQVLEYICSEVKFKIALSQANLIWKSAVDLAYSMSDDDNVMIYVDKFVSFVNQFNG